MIHWNAGNTKRCGNERQPTNVDAAGGILFEEFEIVTELEPPIRVTPEKSQRKKVERLSQVLRETL